MKFYDVFSRTNLITGAANFIISLSLLLLVYLNLTSSLEIALALSAVTYVALCIIVIVSRATRFHSRIFGPMRRALQFALSAIVINEWKVTISVDDSETAHIVHDFRGSVNFEHNKWIVIGVLADEPQLLGRDFWIKVTNVETGNEVEPSLVVDYPKYKKFKIHFDRALKTGDAFHYKVEYKLSRSFYLDRDDHYGQDATHFEKKIIIRVNFPQDFMVTKVGSKIETAQGDDWGHHERPSFEENWIEWRIEDAAMMNKHILTWNTKRKQ